MQNGVATLETQLHEKDELVRVLTARLEQAAEQLDRQRRTGTAHGARHGEGFSSDLLDQQQSLVGDLKTAVDRWVQTHPEEALVRIENQLEELRALIVDGTGVPSQRRALDETDNDDADEAGEAEAQGWESLKAEMLAQDAESADEVPSNNVGAADANDEESADDADSPGKSAASDTVEEDEVNCQEPEPPVPVDFDAATADDLRRAVENRDEYISFLAKRLRIIVSRGELAAPDWSQLQDAPEKLRRRLEELEGRLEEMLRISEVEISLERARLSREETRLKQIQHEVEKRVAMMGKTAKSGTDGEPADAEGRKGRRWLKFLGAGKDDAAAE